ncbi:MAG: hypothetical protein J0L62_12605 [Bacteroidetes bacterium]|nr:hypothetical protein [Bacteroidota bacterium]
MNRIYFYVIFSLISFSAMAQNESDLIRYLTPIKGIGAQSVGLGYSNTLISNDNSSLFLNPAAVGMIKKTTLNVNLNYDGGSVKSTWLNNSTDLDFSNTKINQFSMTYPYPVAQGSFVLAFGYGQTDNFDQIVKGGGFNPTSSFVEGIGGYDPNDSIPKSRMKNYVNDRIANDLFYEFGFEAYLLDSVYTGSNPNLGRIRSTVFGNVQQSYKSISEGGMNTWSFAVSTEITKGIFAGVSAHFLNGDYYNQYYYTEKGDEEFYKSRSDSGIIDRNGIKRVFSSFYMEEIVKETISGYSVKFGLITKFDDELSGGVSFTLPTSLTVDTKKTVDLESQFINVNSSVDKIRIGTQFPYDYSSKYELSGASNLEVNVAYSGFPFIAEVGLSTMDWSNTRIKSSDDSDPYDDINDFFRFDTKRTWDAKAGVQYAVPFLQSFVRAGIYSQDSPYKSGGDRINRYSLGYQFLSADGYSIDFGYQYVNSSESFTPYKPKYKPSVVNTEEKTLSLFSVAFSMKF